MEKNKQRLLTVLWILAAVTTRILYFLFGGQTIADPYGYYSHAMLKAQEAKPMLTSGMAYAYTENLSELLPYLEKGMESLAVFQLILQIIWMVFLIIGMGILFGSLAQFLTGGILMASPSILETVFVVSPENCFMFYFSALFLALALFFWCTKKKGWYRSSFCEVFLMLIGFGMGVLCIWNYMGWFLFPVVLYILNRNGDNLKNKIWEQKQKEIYLEKQQVMKVGSQAGILAVGQFLGMYAALMKYTGLTGNFVGEQFQWWIVQYKDLPGRCQDISPLLAALLLLAGVAGILCSLMFGWIMRRRLQNQMYEDEVYLQEEPLREEKDEKNYVITEDGRKVELLDNPLPVPKRHEKREMDFKLNDFSDRWAEKEETGTKADDFDVRVSENDDFDV